MYREDLKAAISSGGGLIFNRQKSVRKTGRSIESFDGQRRIKPMRIGTVIGGQPPEVMQMASHPESHM